MKTKSKLVFLLYSVLLGGIVGAIVWTFLRVMNLGITLLWHTIPEKAEIPFYTLIVCTVGGVLVGLWKKKFGDYPEELNEVMKQVKEKKRYPYGNVFSTIVSAMLPLVFGASIGPEAGLTGVIAGLCTWVGDKLKKYLKETEELTQIGMSATLGTIFRAPMFGFIEPIESDEETSLPKTSKIVLYLAAIISSLGCFIMLGRIFGGGVGMEALEVGEVTLSAYLYAVLLILIGILAGYLFFAFRKLSVLAKEKTKNLVILRAAVGGVLLGIAGTALPLTMFSGEHQISEVMLEMNKIGAVTLLLVALVKLAVTNICIESGLKGGHFFPVIFCGICIGCAMSMVLNIDAVFCAAVVTTALVGHTLKKPLATVLLMMIVFPPRLIPVMLAAAAAAKFIATPKVLLPEEE